MLFVVKAASKFQKALGQKDAHVIHKLYNDMRKQRKVKKHRSAKLVDVQNQVTKTRATFINFRRKLQGGLAEDENDEEQAKQQKVDARAADAFGHYVEHNMHNPTRRQTQVGQALPAMDPTKMRSMIAETE